jgi:TRAP-type C4-dicarboxylate transport system substrate-binding protein
MKAKLSIIFFSSLIIILLLSSVASMTGCTSEATTTTETLTTTETTTAATFVFKFLDQYTPQQAAAKQSELVGDLIEEATGGRIKFDYYHSESLGKSSEFLNLLEGGVTDVVNFTPGRFPTQFEITSFVNLPGLGLDSRESCQEVIWALYDAGYLPEFDNYKVLAFNPTPPMNIWLKNKVTTVDGLEGLKIRAGDPNARTMLDLIGAVGTSMSSGDVYMGLERGSLDGTMTADEQVVGTKLYEQVKFGIYEPKLLIGCIAIVMTKDTWNSLPKDLQDKVDEAIEENKTAFLESVKEEDASYPEILEENGVELYSLSAEESAKLLAAALPLKEDWIAAQEAKGVPAQEMADLTESILEKYK